MNNTSISTLGCMYQPRYNIHRFDGMTDYHVWLCYKNSHTDRERDEALDALYMRHDKMFIKLAKNMATYHPEVGTFEDFLQSARLGAMQAYDNYNANKADASSAKLSTYVYSCVYHSLLSTRDADWFIPCPSQKRAMRAYLKGSYDENPEKKQKFEEKNGIRSEADVLALRERYKLIVDNDMISLDSDFVDSKGQQVPSAYDELIEDDTVLQEDNIILYMQLNETKEKLSPRRQEIFDLFFVEEFRVSEIAEQLNVPAKNVRDDILYIRKHFKRTMPNVMTV